MAALSIRDRILSICKEKQEQGVLQDELSKRIEGVALEDLAAALNELLRDGRIRAFQSVSSTELVYKIATQEEYEKLKGMPQECVLIYRLIEGHERNGVWSGTLKTQSRLQPAALQRALKTLESKELIKTFKSVLAKNKRYYILFHLQPSVEHQGGVGYGPDMEFNREFVDSLATSCYSYIDTAGFASINDIQNHLNSSGLSHVDLQLDDVQKLVDTLIYDGKVEEIKNPKQHQPQLLYRLSRVELPANGLSLTPCGACPVFNLCSDTGDITPRTCVYMKEWLDSCL